MELTGKCKEDFDKWCIEWFNTWMSERNDTNKSRVDKWSLLHPSMQYGVIVDFFDSVGQDVEWLAFQLTLKSDEPRERHQRWAMSITKANEIYNSTNA